MTLLSSLDVHARDAACRRLAAGPLAGALREGVPVVLHDLLEGGVVLRRIFRDGQLVDTERTLLEHGCLSCTVRWDVVPTIERLSRAGTLTRWWVCLLAWRP